MGTAGRNMALSDSSLGEIFYMGMSHAAEAVGCGNEMEDSLRNGYVKIPSWPLYYTTLAGDISKGFASTMKRSDTYLEQARISLDILPDNFTHIEFLKFLFLTVSTTTNSGTTKLQRTTPGPGFVCRKNDVVGAVSPRIHW